MNQEYVATSARPERTWAMAMPISCPVQRVRWRDAGHAIGNSHNADAAAPNQRGSGELSAVPVPELLGLNHGAFIGKNFAR